MQAFCSGLRMRGLFAALVVLEVGSARAQDFDAGMTAYLLGDKADAINYWRPLADAGSAEAKFMIGQAAYESFNFALALKAWMPLAKLGNPRAQNGLGYMYYFGEGVPQDYVMSHMWFNIACSVSKNSALKSENGSHWGCSGRDAVRIELSPSDIIEAQRLARLCMQNNYSDCG
jgi:uncharacterized protein